MNSSTFFPRSRNKQKIQAETAVAFKNKRLVGDTGNKYEGFKTRGQKIVMYLDESGNIKTAFPEL